MDREHSHESKYGKKREANAMMYGPGCCANGPPDSHNQALAKARARARADGTLRPNSPREARWGGDRWIYWEQPS